MAPLGSQPLPGTSLLCEADQIDHYGPIVLASDAELDPHTGMVEAMQDGRLEGIVLKDRRSTYRDGSRAGWTKVKDRSWCEREAWRFDRR